MLASADAENLVQLRDVRTGKSLAFFREHLGPVRGVAFSPDGRALAHGGDDNSARLWNVKAGVQSSVLQGPSNHGLDVMPMVMGVAFSPDGKTLASTSFQSVVRLWDLQTGKLAASLKWLVEHPFNHPYSGNVAFSPDGTLVAAVYEDGKMRLWNVLTRQQQAVFQSESDVLWGLAFSPDGSLLAFSGGSTDVAGAAYLWDVKTAQELAVLNATSRRVTTYTVAFSPDGRLLAAGNSDGTIQLWDVKTKQIHVTLESHKPGITDIAFSPDGSVFVSGGGDGSLIVWEVATGKEQFIFTDLRNCLKSDQVG
jgi:WD40 repeat protein